MFHVRSVTQGDVIRAEAKEIPRIFQLLYAGEGEARLEQQNHSLDLSALRGGNELVKFKGITLFDFISVDYENRFIDYRSYLLF